jgi:two-component system sensor histidine kinase HydH
LAESSTAIKLLVQTGLEATSPGGLPAEDLTVVEQEVRRMEECIRMFLDFARPPRSERRSTDLAAVIHRAVVLVEGRARRQQVQLVTEFPPTPTMLMIDPEQVNQVLVNLLLNALDTLPQGGTVCIEIHRNELAQEIEVSVRDNGTGIAPAVRDRLFEPFVSTKESGLGLGLSISKRLIEAHGGTIRGENAPIVGAVFTLTFPLEKESASANHLARV